MLRVITPIPPCLKSKEKTVVDIRDAGRGGSSPPENYPLDPSRYAVVALVWLATFLFWMAWFMQGPLLESYWGRKEHVSFGSSEYLLSAVTIVCIATALVAGYGYDRFGPRKASALCLAFIALGFGLRPFTTGNFSATLILTIVAGVGMPFIVAPAAIAAQWFGRHRMNLPLALGYSAVPAGQAAGQLLGARMWADLGITWAFGVMSIALVAVLLLWWVVVPEAPKQPAGPPAVKAAPLWAALREVIRIENALILFGVAAVSSGAVIFTGSFLNTFLDSTYHLSPVQGGNDSSVFSAASFLGVLVLGYLARRSKTTREFGLGTAAGWLLSWLAIAIAWFVGGIPLWAVLVLLAISGFCQAPSYSFGVNALERSRGIRPETVGVAAGFYFTGSAIGGFVFPTIIARIVDVAHTGAGLVGPLVLVAAGTTLWVATFIPRRRARRTPVVAQQATVSQ
jgi:MFS family permease